jgi:hypothetical protein
LDEWTGDAPLLVDRIVEVAAGSAVPLALLAVAVAVGFIALRVRRRR